MIQIPNINISIIYPEIIIFITAVIILLVEIFSNGKKWYAQSIIALIGIIVSGYAVSNQWNSFASGFSEVLVADNFALMFKLIFLLGALLTVFLSIWYFRREEIQQGEYFFLILSSVIGMMILSSANELITAFLGLEVMSLPLYVLAGFDKKKLLSNEAALKYFIMGAFASGFLVYGITFIYGATGTTNFDKISMVISSRSFGIDPLLLLGFILILIGFSFKTAFVPFHSWVPDVYTGAPTPVTAFFSIGPKAAGFAILFRLIIKAFAPIGGSIIPILWILAVLTMTVGNLIALTQRNIKRMLAYSSIAHAGYLLISLVVGNGRGASAALFYLIAYTVMTVGAFGIVILLGEKGEKDLSINGYSGLAYRYPAAAVVMSLFMFSLAGIPPTAGFIGKFYIFSSAISKGFIWLAVIGIVNSVISVYYYLRVVVVMFMKPEIQAGRVVCFPVSLMVAIILAAIGVLQIGMFPQGWFEAVRYSLIGLF